MNPIYKLHTFVNTLCLFTALSFASFYALAENEDDNWHQIEYLIFQHMNSDKSSLRFEYIDKRIVKSQNFLYMTGSLSPISPNQRTDLFDTDSTEDFELDDARKRLEQSQDVRLLSSGAWQQVILENNPVPPLKIREGKRSENTQPGDRRNFLVSYNENQSMYYAPNEQVAYELEGKLLIKKKRYIHVGLNLFLSDFIRLPYEDLNEWFIASDRQRLSVFDLTLPLQDYELDFMPQGFALVPHNTYQLKQTRRIKNGEIHYLDHPVIGAIVTVKSINNPNAIEENFE